jgi:iron complex outermembrane receptor protein
MFSRKPLYLAILAGLTSNSGWAEESTEVIAAPVVVTATRAEQNSFDLPVAIDVVDTTQIQDGQLQMTLSESLIRVPGITAQNRNQLAQDPQISIRGFGARSSFGVRGVRVYQDGIPLSMPDGVGQPGVVDLAAAKSIEVMRGPFSALYGSSSGGVINILSEDAPAKTKLGGSAMFGSYDTRRQTLEAGGTVENLEYQLQTSHYESDGYRDHSASKKDMATAKVRLNISEDTRLTALVNWFDQPETQDPLGLSRTAAFSDPKSVHISAINANTRVERDHTQVGFNLEHRFNQDNDISLVAYVGDRSNLQYLSTSANGSAGRASEIERTFWGMEARWNNSGRVLDRPYKFSLGTAYGKMDDDRLDTNTTFGVINNVLNRDENQTAWNFDQYAQGQWSVLEALDLHAGIRHTKVQMEIDDHLPAQNGNGTGSVTHEKTTPVIGAVWKVTQAFNLYANYGKGFETPTLVEVAYADTAGNGPNLDLKSSESDNYEIGAKVFATDNTLVNLAVFRTTTNDEIVAGASAGGRTVYRNAGRTSRKGVELSLNAALPYNFSFNGAYTLLDAEFESDTSAGNKLPGTYHNQIYGEIAWQHAPSGFSAAFEGRYNSEVYVDDANSDQAPSYTVFNLRSGFKQSYRGWNLSEFVRLENVFDKEYIGSIRVNDTNGRYFEPAPGRTWLLGLSASYQF